MPDARHGPRVSERFTPSPDRVDVWRVPCGTAPGERDAALRRVLARVTDGAAFTLAREPNGRPRVSAAGLDLRVSFAQRGTDALVAVRLTHDLGVDLEMPHRGLETGEMARDHFDETAQAEFFADPDPDRDAAFLRAWTRHEALAKACGAGIVAAWPADARERFDVRTLALPGAFAAVASEGRDWDVRLREER